MVKGVTVQDHRAILKAQYKMSIDKSGKFLSHVKETENINTLKTVNFMCSKKNVFTSFNPVFPKYHHLFQ